MTPIGKKIGSKIYEEVIVKELDAIESGLRESSAIGPSSGVLVEFFNRLSEEDKSLYIRSLRTAFTDAASHVLGILDGSSPFGHDNEYLDLTIQLDDQKVEDLQDYFLEADEIRNKNPIGLLRKPTRP